MAYVRRVPKYGFTNPFRKEFQVINLGRLQELVDAGRIDAGDVSLESLYNAGAVSKRNVPVKVLGNGSVTTKLTVQVHKISSSARESIEGAGGTVTINE